METKYMMYQIFSFKISSNVNISCISYICLFMSLGQMIGRLTKTELNSHDTFFQTPCLHILGRTEINHR